MKNPLLKEVRRVTGWHTLIDHEAFPLLLAAISSTTVLWLYPGVDRIYAAYIPKMQQAAIIRSLPRVIQEPTPVMPVRAIPQQQYMPQVNVPL